MPLLSSIGQPGNGTVECAGGRPPPLEDEGPALQDVH